MSESEKITVYAVVGPTASGKSALALKIASAFGGEIVSLDSMQIYRRMDIGTAKPTPEERARVPHHMIDIAEPKDTFSCADYVEMADGVIRDIHARGKKAIICGGTGLYLDSLLRGSGFVEGTVDASLRAELLEFARVRGADALHEELRAVDPESAEAIHKNNIKRVCRALEIYRLCGVPKSEIDRQSRLSEPRYNLKCICLMYSNREELYRRIDTRVDSMIEAGLAEETKRLYDEGVFRANSTAAQAIGYKELLPYVLGREALEESAEKLKIATRRYAKRQITWFSSKDYVTPLDVCGAQNKKTFEEIVNIASEVFF